MLVFVGAVWTPSE